MDESYFGGKHKNKHLSKLAEFEGRWSTTKKLPFSAWSSAADA